MSLKLRDRVVAEVEVLKLLAILADHGHEFS